MRIVSVGEIIWDIIGDKGYLGGAPLNFSMSARRLGHDVALVSGVGNDELGERALQALKQAGVDVSAIEVNDRPTGRALVTLNEQGHATFEIPRPAAYDQLRKLREVGAADWVYFGTLFNALPENLKTTLALLDRMGSSKRFYDVNLRTGHWHVGAVINLAQRATVTKLNHVEVRILALDLWGEETIAQNEFCRRWQQEYGCPVVCITCAEDGCAIYRDGQFVEVCGYKVKVADTVGAGDAFAAAFLHGFEQGWELNKIGRFANAAGALVASRAGANPEWSVEEVEALVASAPLASA